MDYMSVIRDSVETSISLKMFRTFEDALFAHIYKSNFERITISKFRNINNFDVNRLQKSVYKAYPINNRPRGNDDIKSVKYYLKRDEIPPIFLIMKNGKYTLLDGAHRVVACYIKDKRYVNAYVIKI